MAAAMAALLLWGTRRPWAQLGEERRHAEFAVYALGMLVFSPLLRQYYLEFGIAPMIRKLCKETGFKLNRIYELFPVGLRRERASSPAFPSQPVACSWGVIVKSRKSPGHRDPHGNLVGARIAPAMRGGE
jgi:hypothetical protein